MAEKKEEIIEKRTCKKCGSGQTYVRIKTGSVVCRSCGFIDPKEE